MKIYPTHGWEELDSITLSADSEVVFTDLDSTYDRYLVRVNTYRPGADGAGLRIRLGYGATPTYLTTSLYTRQGYTITASIADENSSANTISVFDNVGTAGSESGTAEFQLVEFATAARRKRCLLTSTCETSGNQNVHREWGITCGNETQIINTIKLYPSTNVMNTGTVKLYGWKQ